jgi:uncharacterized protein with FMN-binding domain
MGFLNVSVRQHKLIKRNQEACAMSSKTKIVVLHMKEVIYTALFLLLLAVLGLVLFFMFGPGKKLTTHDNFASQYTPGVYRCALSLSDNSFDVEVTVDADKIQAIHLVNLSESTAAMFPLMEPALDSLASQIYSTQSLDNLTYSDSQKYTSELLLRAIRQALSMAENAA